MVLSKKRPSLRWRTCSGAKRISAPFALPSGPGSARPRSKRRPFRDRILNPAGSDGALDFDAAFAQKERAAEAEARKELKDLYRLVEIGEEATIDWLMKDLAVHERLDAMIEKCLKRLLLIRGVKSL